MSDFEERLWKDDIKMIEKLNKELKKKDKIINKAIEYAEENMYELTARMNESQFCKNGELDDILKILKGDDDE